MLRPVRGLSALAVIVGLGAGLTACGGSSAKSAAPATTGGSTTTAAPSGASGSSGSSASETATEPTSDPIAAKAVVVRTDLPLPFVGYRKASGFIAFGAKSCGIRSGSPVSTRDHTFQGAMFKDRAGRFFVYSESYVFRTKALATKYVGVRNSVAYRVCKVKQDDATLRHTQPKDYVKLAKKPFSQLNAHISMYREFQGGPNAAGKPTDVAFYDRYTAQYGRVVVVYSVDGSLQTTARASQTLAIAESNALTQADRSIAKRVSGA